MEVHHTVEMNMKHHMVVPHLLVIHKELFHKVVNHMDTSCRDSHMANGKFHMVYRVYYMVQVDNLQVDKA